MFAGSSRFRVRSNVVPNQRLIAESMVLVSTINQLLLFDLVCYIREWDTPFRLLMLENDLVNSKSRQISAPEKQTRSSNIGIKHDFLCVAIKVY